MEAVPQELQCPLCRNLLTDAVLIPCCGNSFCDICTHFFFSLLIVVLTRGYLGIRNTLPATGNTCPICQRPADVVVPNQKVRQAAEGFKKKYLDSGKKAHSHHSSPPIILTPLYPSPWFAWLVWCSCISFSFCAIIIECLTGRSLCVSDVVRIHSIFLPCFARQLFRARKRAAGKSDYYFHFQIW